MTDSNVTVAILREIRDEARKTNERLDRSNERLDDVVHQQIRLNTSFAEMKEDFGEMKKDFGEMKKDFGEMKKDFGEMKKDFGEMKKDFGEMKKDFGEMKDVQRELLAVTRSLGDKVDRLARSAAVRDDADGAHQVVDALGARVVVAADAPAGVDQHEPLAVEDLEEALGVLAHGELEAADDRRLDGGEIAGEKRPAPARGAEAAPEGGEPLGRVVLGIHRDGDEVERRPQVARAVLDLRHALHEARAHRRAAREDEARHPRLAAELGAAEREAVLVGETEVGERCDHGRRHGHAAPERRRHGRDEQQERQRHPDARMGRRADGERAHTAEAGGASGGPHRPTTMAAKRSGR
jgi:archaellum component FlaC